jgi:hypothetical protein
MLYFPYGQTQPYTLYRRSGDQWVLRHTGTHLINRHVYQQCQVFLSSWLNKSVQGGTSNGVNADLAIESQVSQKTCSYKSASL